MPDHSAESVAARIVLDARHRSASQGPLVAIAELLRQYIALVEELRDIIENVPVQLELTDVRLRAAYGQRWWDDTLVMSRLLGDGDRDDGR